MFRMVIFGGCFFGACGFLGCSFLGVEQCNGEGLFEGLNWSKEGILLELLDDSMPKGLWEVIFRLVSLKNPELKFGSPQVKQCQESECVE